ncbi:hypothetical protein OG216_45660 [Streptomycetaceae bacterium NBC_01309]
MPDPHAPTNTRHDLPPPLTHLWLFAEPGPADWATPPPPDRGWFRFDTSQRPEPAAGTV